MRAGCSFCQLVLSCIQKPLHSSNSTQPIALPENTADGEELFCFVASRVPDLQNPWSWSKSAFNISIDVQIRTIFDCAYSSEFSLERLHAAHFSPVRSAFRREVEDIINFRMASKWIRRCEASTYNLVWSEKINDSTDITAVRYIDVSRNCLVQMTTVPSYAALSYVWGQNTSLKLTRENEHELHRSGGLSPSKLSCTIRDAVLVCRMLSIPFLLVDCLCILQNDNEKHSQIRNMHRVFHFAKVALIAASGIDSDAGLPGVRSGSREIKQPETQFSGLSVGSRLSCIENELSKMVCAQELGPYRSVYCQRGS